MRTLLELESLEARDLMAVATVMQIPGLGNTLIVGGTNGPDRVSVYQGGVNNDLTVVDLDFDGRQDFAVPTAQLQAVLIMGLGGDDVLASQPSNQLPTIILGMDGNDNISSFTSGMLDGGAGNDQIYQIVSPVTITGGPGRDRIIASVQANVTDRADPADDTIVVFGQQQTSPVQLIGRVVYFAGTANNDVATVLQIGGTYLVGYNGQSFSFNAADVDVFAGVLGAGDDILLLSPNVAARSVFYGAAGNDYLQAGAGDGLLKGGAGNDVVLGGNGNDDLTGSNGELNLDVDIVLGGGGANLLRVDATDVIFAGALDQIFGRRVR
jgi:Ca2+-binding RTX toxin-like protein